MESFQLSLLLGSFHHMQKLGEQKLGEQKLGEQQLGGQKLNY